MTSGAFKVKGCITKAWEDRNSMAYVGED